MFVGYVDNHTGNVHRFVSLKAKKIILSGDTTWMNKLYGDIYKQKDAGIRYNLENNTSEDRFIEVETEGESQEPRSIPREFGNLQTSYSNAEAMFKNVTDEHDCLDNKGS